MADMGFWTLAQSRPDRIAVVEDRGDEVTYRQLFEAQNRLSHALIALGAGSGDSAAALLWNQRQFLELQLATAQIGMYFVPINWHLTAPEVAYILTDSEAKVILADARVDSVAADAVEQTALEPHRRLSVGAIAGFADYATATAGCAVTRPSAATAGETMLYTSGTTGRPKGIKRALSGRDPEAAVAPVVGFTSQTFGVPTGEGVQLVTGPLYHATPGGMATVGLHLGHTLVLMDKWEPERTLQLIERHRVSYMHVVPTMFQRLLALPDETKRRYDTSSLVSVLHGAAPCPPDVKRRMIDWWGPVINEYYGSSEGGGAAVDSENWLKRPGTVGTPWPGSTIKIFDESGAECAPNQPGAVYMKMPGFEFEYHRSPDKTRGATRNGMFTVGDVGYLDEEGYLFLSGRTAELIISGGVNIYPAEIEGCLVEHPAVADVAVIGVPSSEWGEEVKSVVELHDGFEPSVELADELIAHCRANLARFKVPRSVDFRAALPRTDTGKLLKRLLREEYWTESDRQL